MRNWEEFNWTREKGVTEEESSEVNGPELCISKTVFILPLNMYVRVGLEEAPRSRQASPEILALFWSPVPR